ncbi:MAG: hypothetical protein AAF847_07290 [Bacteroidota bacterium]
MIESDFKDWTADKVDEVFGMRLNLKGLPSLEVLTNYSYEISDYESRFLKDLSFNYKLGGQSWNEVELENKMISPLIMFANIDNEKFAYFLERNLAATIDNYALSGRVDGMIASGFRSPRQPYFCISEYKRATDPNGDPEGQVLIAMLVAQHLNAHKRPIFGCHIVGRQWVFASLEGKEYAFSKSYTVDDEEIFDIYRILKALKWQISQWIG